MPAKHSKDSVDYSRGHKNSRCGLCAYYRDNGSCTLVEGKIDPQMWCKLFRRAATPAAAE